jgi:hypothetical protein
MGYETTLIVLAHSGLLWPLWLWNAPSQGTNQKLFVELFVVPFVATGWPNREQAVELFA